MLCFASECVMSCLMLYYCYLQRDLASIHSMTSLQAILTAFKEVVADAL